MWYVWTQIKYTWVQSCTKHILIIILVFSSISSISCRRNMQSLLNCDGKVRACYYRTMVWSIWFIQLFYPATLWAVLKFVHHLDKNSEKQTRVTILLYTCSSQSLDCLYIVNCSLCLWNLHSLQTMGGFDALGMRLRIQFFSFKYR